MAHMMKMKSCAIGHMLAHYGRETAGVFRENPNIDMERTKQNYTVGISEPHRLNERIQERIKDVRKSQIQQTGKQPRKDAVTLVDWVVTVPDDLPTEREKEFFTCVYKFNAERYGKENVIGGYVHCDEAGRHHMHLPVVPELDGKFNCKKKMNRNDLRKYHEDLQSYCEKEMGMSLHLLLSDEEKVKKDLSKLDHDTFVTLDVEARVDMVNEEMADMDTAYYEIQSDFETMVESFETTKKTLDREALEKLNADKQLNQLYEAMKDVNNAFYRSDMYYGEDYEYKPAKIRSRTRELEKYLSQPIRYEKITEKKGFGRNAQTYVYYKIPVYDYEKQRKGALEVCEVNNTIIDGLNYLIKICDKFKQRIVEILKQNAERITKPIEKFIEKTNDYIDKNFDDEKTYKIDDEYERDF
jgi:hypothetical protein